MGGVPGAGSPLRPIFFVFMQFSANTLPANKLVPRPRKILDPPRKDILQFFLTSQLLSNCAITQNIQNIYIYNIFSQGNKRTFSVQAMLAL